MLALLRKNLWMWRPSRSANCWVFAIALAFSLADMLWGLSTGFWVFAAMVCMLVAQAGGYSVFDVDFKKDNDRFLEYLPVRWSQVWLANWLDQALACLLLVPLLCWYRILTWKPPVVSGFGEFSLWETRWHFPAGLTAGIFFVYSYALIWRTFFKSDKAAIVPMYIGSFAYIVVPMTIPALMGVRPGIMDWCTLMAFGACLFSLASLAAFVLPPRHWTRFRRFAVFGVPLLIAALVLEIGCVWYSCVRWSRLDWSEPDLRLTMETGGGSHPWLLAHLASERSGTHDFAVDAQAGGIGNLGRNLRFFSPVASSSFDDQLIATSQENGPRFWPLRTPVLLIAPDGGSVKTLLADRFLTDRRGRRYIVVGAHTTMQGGLLVLEGLDRDGRDGRVLFLLDRDGRELMHFQASNRVSQFLVAAGGRILTIARSAEEEGGLENPRITYLLYDARSASESRFELPGIALCFSEDLQRVACLCTRTADGVQHDRIEIVEIPSLRARTVLQEGALPPRAQVDSGYEYRDALPRQTRIGSAGAASDPMFVVDRGFHQAAIIVDRYEQGGVHLSLRHIDLDSGASRVLIDESKFARRGLQSPHARLELYGFSPEGHYVVYEDGSKVTRVKVSDGSALVTSLPDDRSGNVSVSPDGSRIICLRYGAARNSLRGNAVWQIFELGKSAPVYTSTDDDSLQWLDGNHVVVIRKSCAILADADGKSIRQLFPGR